MTENVYRCLAAEVLEVRPEARDVKTLAVRVRETEERGPLAFAQGQFMMISLPGMGEAPFSIASCPTGGEALKFTIRGVGKLTRRILGLRPHDILYLRGPYGNSFPYEEVEGRDLYFVAGGIGLVPLRGLIHRVLENRDAFGKITILYGARTPGAICFPGELERWGMAADTEVLVTVDEGADGWEGHVGLVTSLWDRTDMTAGGGVAYVCGPAVMMRFVARKLLASSFDPRDIHLSLERHMKCGVGKCGHCSIGGRLVCTDGPVFRYAEIAAIPERERVL